MADKQILILNNQRLAVQLEEKKKEHKLLESKVEALERRQQDYAETLLCINRLWRQLEGDVQHLATAAVGSLGDVPALDEKPVSLTSVGATVAAVAAGQRDPYLQRLLQGAPGPATKAVLEVHKQLEADISAIEETLLERSRATQAALAKVLEKVQGLKASQQQLGAKLAAAAAGAAGGGEGGSSAAAAALRDDYERLSSEAAAHRRDLDTARAAERAAQQHLRLAEDRQLQSEERISKLQNELADAEQELSSVQRKVFAQNLRNANSLEFPAPGSFSLPGTPCIGATPGGAAGRTSVVAGGTDAAELAELQELFAKRTAEVDKERDENLRLTRELKEAVARLDDEGWVQTTKVYQVATKQIQSLTEQLAARQKEMEGLAHERDEAQREAHSRSQVYLSESLATWRLQTAEAASKEVQAAKAESDKQRQELQVALQRERDKLGATKTVAELKLMIATLQQEVTTLQQHVRQNKVSQEKLQAASTAAQESARAQQAQEQEAGRLRDTLRRRDSELDDRARQERPIREQLADVQAFVEVLSAIPTDAAVRSAAAIRATEAGLRHQIATLKTQLEGHPLQHRIHELEAAQLASRDQLDLMALEADALSLQLSTAQRAEVELEGQLAAARSECQLYIGEVETTSQAYEDMQSQNMRLLQQLTERDDANNQLAVERLKLHQGHAQLLEQVAAARSEVDKLHRELSDMGNVRDATQQEVQRVALELMQTKEQHRAAVSRCDALTQDVRRRDDSLAQAAAVSASQAASLAAAKAAAEEAAERLVKEKTKRQRLDEENQSLQSKLERAKKAASAASAAAGGAGGGTSGRNAMQEEVDAMRTLLNCNVCHERQKNTVIVKCGHVFCDRCVKSIVDARSRKCPGCGAAFASSDVKAFFFT